MELSATSSTASSRLGSSAWGERSVEKSSGNESAVTWESVAEMFRDPVSPEVVEPYQFIFDSPQVRASVELADYAVQSFPAGTPLVTGARELTRRIFSDFKYDPKATTVATPLEEVWEKRQGRLPGFCASGDLLPAFAWFAGALRKRLPAHAPARGRGTARGRRRLARVVRGILSRHGLD